MKNELYGYKKRNCFKWFATIIAVLLLTVLTAAVFTQGLVTKKTMNINRSAKTVNNTSAEYSSDISTYNSEGNNTFGGTISIKDVVEKNNVLCLYVDIKGFFYFGYLEWLCNKVTIYAVTKDNGGATYTKEYERAPNEYIPLTEIGAFNVYGNYTISVDVEYVYTGDGTKKDCSATFKYNHIIPSLPLPPDPVQEGYTFIGWFFDEANTLPYDGSPITENTELFAGFRINKYTVGFDVGGGTDIAAQTIDFNTIPTISIPIRTGYDFVGWYIGETEYKNEPIKSATTLTAKWKAKTFTVTFKVNGEVYREMTVEYNTSLTPYLEIPALAKYNIASLFAENGQSVDMENMLVNGNLTVDLTEKTSAQNVISSLPKILLSVAMLIVGLALIFCLIFGKKKKSRFKA